MVAAHPEYKQDSVISEGLAYDLLMKFSKVGRQCMSDDILTS